MPRTFLLTGSRGFIGRRILTTLLQAGNLVHSFDLVSYKSLDALSREVFRSLAHRPYDGIFHVGALTDTLATDVNRVLAVNYEFTASLSDLAREIGTPLIYSSSAANYGSNGLRPSNLYGWSKFIGEKIVQANGQVALRYFNVFGPGESDKGRMASFIFQAFEKSNRGEQVRLFPGNPKRDFIHVDDIVSANLLAMDSFRKIKGKYFDVGMGQSTSFEALMDWAGISFTYDEETAIPEGYQFFTRANKSRFVPSWRPTLPLKDRVIDYVRSLSEAKPL